MKAFTLMFAFSFSFFAQASTLQLLSTECEKKVIREAIKNKETNLFLDFEIEAISEDLVHTIVTVNGGFSDADADYQYAETHQIYLAKGSCQILTSFISDIFED